MTPFLASVVQEEGDKAENQVIYQENGVTIRSRAAIGIADGPVSYALEWNGYKFVFGGNSFPNGWFVEHETNADLVMHECFLTPELMMKYSAQSPMDKEKNNEYT